MSTTPSNSSRPGRLASVLAPLALIAGLALVATPQAGAAKQAAPVGAPKQAEVRFESLMGVPPGGYSLFCNGLPACSTGGSIDLATKAEVPVQYTASARATRGAAPLSFSSADGEVSMSFSCEGSPDPYRSRVAVAGTKPGELEVAGVRGVPGGNALAVALNHGGESGGDFPQEIVDRSDGGCGSPVQDQTQTMGTWYFQFYNAHRNEQQPSGNDLELSGLTYEDGVFAKTYDRIVTVGTGAYSYPTYERTRIEVEPQYCAGKQNRIASAVADGQSLGIDGMRFYPGQVVNVPAKAKFRLGDGSVIEVDDATSFQVGNCETNETKIELLESVGSFWIHVKKALAGSEKKFEVETERAVAGVRGTIFEVRYDEANELTRVAVEESSVYLKGRRGAKGKVVVKAGQVGLQKGKKSPRIVKG